MYAITPFPTCSCTFSADVFFFLFLYIVSKFCLIIVPLGMTYAPRKNVMMEINAAEIMYGRISLLKLTPAASIDIISELPASFDVKNITAMKTNNGLNRLAK